MAAQSPERRARRAADNAGMDGLPQVQAAGSVMGLSNVAWHISTRSADNGGSCVEAGPLLDGSGRVAVRHSHFPDGVAIVYTRVEWEAFVGGVKNGEFDFFDVEG